MTQAPMELQAVWVMRAHAEDQLPTVTSVLVDKRGQEWSSSRLTSVQLQSLQQGSPRQAAHAEPGHPQGDANWWGQHRARVALTKGDAGETRLELGGFLLLIQRSSIKVRGVGYAAGRWYLSLRAGCSRRCGGRPDTESPGCTAKQSIFPVFR